MPTEFEKAVLAGSGGGSNDETTEVSSVPDTNTIGVQYLSPEFGQPFKRGVLTGNARPSTDSFKDAILSQGRPRVANSQQFQPVPASPQTQQDTAFQVISSIVDAEKISPWNANAIRQSIRLSADVPQAAYILSNPSIVDKWQETIWSHTMSSLGSQLTEVSETAINNPNEANARYVADFFKANDSTFSSEERKFVMNLIAAMPDAATILKDANVQVYGSGFWNDLRTGWQAITRAPEAIRPTINDPRKQLITEMHEWLKANPLKTLEDRSEFFMFFYDRAATSIKDVNANASGFFALAESTVSLPFTVAGNVYNDWINSSADPDSFSSKRNLSLGQTLAIGSGVNPGDDWYTTVSGLIDGVVNVVGDPTNLAFGVGNGIKNASRVPRLASKGDMYADAFRVFGGGRRMNLPVFDRGIISRFTYAAFSRSVDELVESDRATKLWSQLARISSESEIVDIMPAWAQSERLVSYIAKYDDPAIIKELVRNGIKHPESLADDAPALVARTLAELENSVKSHSKNLRAYLEGGGSLQGVAEGLDEVQPVVLVRPIIEMNENTADLATLRSIMDSADDFVDQPVVREVNIAGRPVEIRGSGDAMGAFDKETGQYIGGVKGGWSNNPQIGTDPDWQRKGVFSAIRNEIPGYGKNRGKLIRDGKVVGELDDPYAGMSDMAKRANGIGDEGPIFKIGELSNDGTTKYAVSTLGTSGKGPINIETHIDEISTHLLNSGFNEDAVALTIQANHPRGAARLSNLSPEAQAKVLDWLSAKGHDFAFLGDEMLVSRQGREMLLKGPDLEGAPKAMESIKDSYVQLVDARMRYNEVRSKMDPRLWVINDPGLNALNLTKRTRLALSSKSNSKFMQGLRRQGFRMTHRYPSNISLTQTGEGSQQLRNWIKAIGGSDDLANKWGDEFRRANPATRKDVILAALSEAGEELKNPMLREGLIQFGNKQGQYTYFYGRNGAELGLAADGSITPLALAHFTDNFAMPDAKSLLRSIKRYNQAKRMPATSRGLLVGTRKNRQAIADNIAMKMKRLHGIDNVDPQDLMAMAYADIYGAEYGRATGFGAVHKAASVFSSAYSMLHNVFVIGQLAFRPIAWSSRVLMEETVRANLFDLPSIWRNPTRWAQDLADSMAIRKLPQRLQEQGQVAEGLVNALYIGGDLDFTKAQKLIPNLTQLLDDAGVAIGDGPRTQAFIASYVGKELMGQGTTAGQLGARGNITRRALRTEKRLRRTVERMDEAGMAGFQWDIDGQAIAQRSFWQQFVTESEGATVPLEYTLGSMTPKGLLTYGRAYGRQVYQMSSDPIVSVYGFNRAIARATGEDVTYNAEKLVRSKQWANVKHVAAKKVRGDGLEMSDLELADWYLTQVDEIVSTLFDPLALKNGEVDLAEKTRILREIKNGGTVRLSANGTDHLLNADPSNYEGFVKAMANYTEGAYAEGRQLPGKIAAYLDPRFGQSVHANGFRRYTDWAMNTFGEQLTQKLHRQPAFTHVHGKYYRYYRDLGWESDLASDMASQRAAQLVNYIYFDNNNIPGFLKDMNKVIPFFSAMWEVGSTWAYKIPSHNVLPVGYMQLGRRVDRVLQGLMASGLVSYDGDNNAMSMNLSWDMENADSPLVRGVGRTLYSYMRLPVELLEYLGGVKNLVLDQEWEKGDLSAWAKDGFSIGIGNPLDPTSHGLMAVNQFSVGATPLIQYPVSMGANAIFAQSDQRIDVEENVTIGQFLVDNPDYDIGEILRYNEDAFTEVNGDEAFNRALNGDIDLNDIVMPDNIRIPHTSTWEMLTNRLVFPFGRMESAGEIITSVSPSALNYVWRGLLQKFGGEGADEIAGMLFGQMSGYSMASELLTQIQMDEAATGSVSKIMDMASEAWGIVEKLELEVKVDEDSAVIILDANSEDAVRAQELFNKIHSDNAALVKRANDNAAGASIMRGIMGQFGPVTPRMWTRQQQAVASYWASREMSKEAEATGSVNYAKLMADSNINSFEDMMVLAGTASAWLEDKTGDAAKTWLKQEHPALMPFIQGKSYWGPAGPPPQITTFDQWIDQMESGDRKPFSPEVWMARYQRTGIAVDKEIAVISRYGNDPDKAAQEILYNMDEYSNLIEDYNMRYDALEFLDTYLYDGAYAAYRSTELDQLSLLELIEERKRDTQEEIDVMQDMLLYGNLEPDERRRVVGVLKSAYREYDNAVSSLQSAENDDIFMNPREVVIDRWWAKSNEYYSARNEIYDMLEGAQDKTDRSILFERLRNIDDDWYLTPDLYRVEGWNGDLLDMPSPQERTWNARSQQERQERILNMVGKKPEWLSQFEVEVLASESPVFGEVLPMTPEERNVYRQASEEKWALRRAWQNDPTIMTKSARDKAIGEIDAAVDEWLIANGRGSEVAFRDMVPFMRLHETGLLPESLSGVVPVLAGILEDLKSQDKSPRTNVGYEQMMRLKQWMENVYFAQNPDARTAFFNLGSGMFGEPVPSAVYAKLLQDDFFGELG